MASPALDPLPVEVVKQLQKLLKNASKKDIELKNAATKAISKFCCYHSCNNDIDMYSNILDRCSKGGSIASTRPRVSISSLHTCMCH